MHRRHALTTSFSVLVALLAATLTAAPAHAIVGGTDQVSEGLVAPLAFIQISEPTGLAGCSGTLIAPAVVMTAAHCVTGEGSVHPRSRALDIVAGKLRLRSASPARVHVVSVRVHPGYNAQTLANDLALLELARPVSAVAQLDDGAAETAGVSATAIGWGSTTAKPEGDYPDALRQTDIDVEPELYAIRPFSGSDR